MHPVETFELIIAAFIAVLALHFVEQGGSGLVLAAVQLVLGGVVERVDVARDVAGVGAGGSRAAGAARQGNEGGANRKGKQRTRDVEHGGLLS